MQLKPRPSLTPAHAALLVLALAPVGGLMLPSAALAQATPVLCADAATPTAGVSVAGINAIACGQGSVANGANASAFGATAQATAASASAFGLNSTASGLESAAFGFTSLADGRGGTALGGRSRASATFSTAVGWANTASGVNSFAGGNRSLASGASAVALGDQAQATGDLSMAIGSQARATAANSVALGAGSVASEVDTVSVGTATVQRRITNVAAGVGANDVATFGQMQSGFTVLNERIDRLDVRADRGAAAAMAIAGLPQAFRPGAGMIGAAIGTWGGEAAFAFGASKVLDDGRTVFKAGATVDSKGSGGGNAGVGFQF